MINKLIYTLQLADNALILGHRMSEWCGHGPILEQDIAITNMALDHLGQARSYYQYAAEQFNALSKEEKSQLFSSVAFDNMINEGKSFDEDDFAYLRDSWDFKNVLLVEQPNNDWAYTVVRSFLYDVYNYHLYTELKDSSDAQLAAIAEKSLKEVTYHLRWSSEWMIRLGDGTEESHNRVQKALDDLWIYSGELTIMSEVEQVLATANVIPNASALKPSIKEHIDRILDEATLTLPDITWMHEGGKQGRHSEHLGYILTELQYMQRAYPDMEW